MPSWILAACCNLPARLFVDNFWDYTGLARVTAMMCLFQPRREFPGEKIALTSVLTALLIAIFAGSAIAQVHGVPPSVTSIQFHVPPFLPNIGPSVTSLGPYPAFNHSPFPPPYGVPRNGCQWGCRHRGSSGYYGGGYYAPIYAAVPYYYDTSDPGPYLYSGAPSEQPLHVVVDLPPGTHIVADEPEEPAMNAPPAVPIPYDDTPAEPTVLVFRDGHRQEIANYAIMGQTIYIFDAHKQKIGLDDLDIPSTIKANDDRGVDFRLPSPKQG